MKIKPLYDRVLILPEQVNVSQSGILIPKSASEGPQVGKIIAIGDGESVDMDRCNMKLKVDDKVLYNKFSGYEFEMDKITYVLMRQVDILGVIYE